jgi:hypothetical protein
MRVHSNRIDIMPEPGTPNISTLESDSGHAAVVCGKVGLADAGVKREQLRQIVGDRPI